VSGTALDAAVEQTSSAGAVVGSDGACPTCASAFAGASSRCAFPAVAADGDRSLLPSTLLNHVCAPSVTARAMSETLPGTGARGKEHHAGGRRVTSAGTLRSSANDIVAFSNQ
jgi:hypothetical protein